MIASVLFAAMTFSFDTVKIQAPNRISICSYHNSEANAFKYSNSSY